MPQNLQSKLDYDRVFLLCTWKQGQGKKSTKTNEKKKCCTNDVTRTGKQQCIEKKNIADRGSNRKSKCERVNGRGLKKHLVLGFGWILCWTTQVCVRYREGKKGEPEKSSFSYTFLLFFSLV